MFQMPPISSKAYADLLSKIFHYALITTAGGTSHLWTHQILDTFKAFTHSIKDFTEAITEATREIRPQQWQSMRVGKLYSRSQNMPYLK